MSSRVSSANLEECTKKLMAEWSGTRTYWADAKSREFERDYLEQLPNMVAQTRNAVEELDLLLRKVRHECE
jgi:hypothetical protein